MPLFAHAPETGLEGLPQDPATEIGSWYAEAVLYRLGVGAFYDADHDGLGDFEGLIRKLPYLQSLGVTCVDLFALNRDQCAEFVRFRLAARTAGVRVLVELAGDAARQRDETGFWLDSDADGVVLTGPPAACASRCARRARPAPDGNQRRRTSFVRVNGVPVPCADGQDAIGALGAFRSQVVPTLMEGFTRQSSVPLLGLMVRLALRMTGGRAWQQDDDEGWLGTPTSASGSQVPLRLARLTEGPGPRLNLLHALLFALPGPPLLVFGDEIGMDDVVRDPAGNWSPMRWRRGQDGDVVSVQSQDRLRSSLLNRVRTLARQRRRSNALSCGNASPVGLGAGPGLSFLRECGGETILVVANFSPVVHVVECDLSGHEGNQVEDIAGEKPFPPVLDAPYRVALGPYGWNWLRLVTH